MGAKPLPRSVKSISGGFQAPTGVEPPPHGKIPEYAPVNNIRDRLQRKSELELEPRNQFLLMKKGQRFGLVVMAIEEVLSLKLVSF